MVENTSAVGTRAQITPFVEAPAKGKFETVGGGGVHSRIERGDEAGAIEMLMVD